MDTDRCQATRGPQLADGSPWEAVDRFDQRGRTSTPPPGCPTCFTKMPRCSRHRWQIIIALWPEITIYCFGCRAHLAVCASLHDSQRLCAHLITFECPQAVDPASIAAAEAEYAMADEDMREMSCDISFPADYPTGVLLGASSLQWTLSSTAPGSETLNAYVGRFQSRFECVYCSWEFHFNTR